MSYIVQVENYFSLCFRELHLQVQVPTFTTNETSLGISTIYLAAAMRDNDGGTIIGTEIVPLKTVIVQQL